MKCLSATKNSYRWGYAVGILLVPLGIILPNLRLIDPFLAPLAWGEFVTLMAVCAVFPLAELGIHLKKSFGWYLFYGFIALCVFGFVWGTILPFIAGGIERFSIIFGGISLTLATLLLLFLILQVKYWKRRSASL